MGLKTAKFAVSCERSVFSLSILVFILVRLFVVLMVFGVVLSFALRLHVLFGLYSCFDWRMETYLALCTEK